MRNMSTLARQDFERHDEQGGRNFAIYMRAHFLNRWALLTSKPRNIIGTRL